MKMTPRLKKLQLCSSTNENVRFFLSLPGHGVRPPPPVSVRRADRWARGGGETDAGIRRQTQGNLEGNPLHWWRPVPPLFVGEDDTHIRLLADLICPLLQNLSRRFPPSGAPCAWCPLPPQQRGASPAPSPPVNQLDPSLPTTSALPEPQGPAGVAGPFGMPPGLAQLGRSILVDPFTTKLEMLGTRGHVGV